MNDMWRLMPALTAGLLLGAMFFGGLWWTVRMGVSSQRPAWWFLGSLLLRMSIAMSGLYVVSGGHWDRLLICLCGFAIARLLVTRLTRLPEKPVPLRQEAGDAS